MAGAALEMNACGGRRACGELRVDDARCWSNVASAVDGTDEVATVGFGDKRPRCGDRNDSIVAKNFVAQRTGRVVG